MRTSHDVIVSLMRTEKGASMEPLRKYLFRVSMTANKIEIRRAVEQIYKVKVEQVNTATMRGKNRRVRHQIGKTPNWKKAIVTLAPENKIETI
ncbi:MAG: 50S ribosomal protein L23 [Candidatus Omnitrophica bacterium]|nr:50S ribosomal protein L23 [Candidatus Omnitrophota bacterium]